MKVFFTLFLSLIFPLYSYASVSKVILLCDGSATVTASEQINILSTEAKKAVKVKPMTLRAVLGEGQLSIGSYEYKKIETIFADQSSLFTFKHGDLVVKDAYYDGYLSVETDKQFKDSKDRLERDMYSYSFTRIFINRLDGEFNWKFTLYGSRSWINDLLPHKVKDKYLHLEVTGLCKRDTNKVLF